MSEAADHLEKARAALGDQPIVALNELLAAWRTLHAPRLGQFIDWVSARLPVQPVDAQHTWLELARVRDAAALPGLLATISAPGFREAERRAEALQGWLDPRISSGLLSMLGAPRYRASGAQWFYERIFKVLAEQRDPRVPPALEALAARMHEIITNSYGAALAKVMIASARAMEIERADEGPHRAALDALEEHFVSERADASRAIDRKAQLAKQEGELRARALANPDDDGHFLVWADVLTEQGDPRGELMSLQLMERKGALAPEQLTQLRALQSKHRDRLLGAIAPGVINAVFERGVAVHVELGRQWTHPDVGISEWSTVRGVTLPESGGNEWPAFLTALPKLRDVLRVDLDVLRQMLEVRPQLTLEHVLLFSHRHHGEQLEVPAKHLAARDVEFAPLLRAHAGESVTLESQNPDEAVQLLEKSRARTLRFVDGVHLLEPHGWYGWCCEFDASERVLTVRGRFSGPADFARLDAWRAACARLRPRETKLDDSPQRDALYLPLQRVDFANQS